jgi:DNA segregation ATPase FtsK/SpoIIIE-like protein
MKDFIESEIKIINGMFRHNKIMAKVIKAENVLKSFVRYHLSLHASQQFAAVERIQREMSAALAKNRQRQGIEATDIILCTKPNFGLEVKHPKPQPLLWPMRKLTTLQPETMLCGLSALDGKSELIEFNKLPHVLIAGMTNAGKSVLLQMMVLSLVANNHPNDLGLVLIDLKNEDLAPFKNLPHVISYNYDLQSATEAINFMVAEKNKRVEENQGKRIVLVIDELAQLANDRKLSAKLGDLASIGRSKRLNLIAATQSVTKDGGIGSMMKANFSCRLIGKVAPGLSSVATGMAKMQAHLLPGYGSFIRIEGDKNHRFQSYYIDQSDVKLMVNHVAKQYKQQNMQPIVNGVDPSFQQENRQFYTSTAQTNTNTSLFPIGYCRDLTASEIDEVKKLASLPEYQYNGKPSLSKLVVKVYGSKNVGTLNKVKEVIKND